MDQIPAPIPFNVARAYGLGSRPASQIEAKPGITPQSKADTSDITAKLVAGVVAGPVRFSAESAARTPSRSPDASPAQSFPLYRHPADQNAAATSIDAGRKLDTQA